MKKEMRAVWDLLHRLDLSIARGFSTILILRFVEKISGFMVTVFLFRMLEKDQVAEYGFIQTVAGLCAIFGIQEFQNTVSQSVARGYPGTYRASVPVALSWSLFGVSVIGGFGIWYLWSGRSFLGEGFLIAAGVFPAFHALCQWKGVYLGEKNFTRFATAEASSAILKAFLIVAALIAFQGSIVIPILIFFGVPAAQNLLQTRMCFRRIPAHAPVEESAIDYGLKSNWYSAIGVVANNLDRLLIFTLLSPPLLAIFMAAEKFAEIVQSVVQDLGAVLAPKFSTIERYTYKLDNILKLFSFAMGVTIILFAIFALPRLVILVYGPGYAESVFYAQALVGAVAVRNIATLRFRFIRSKLDAISYRNVLVVSSLCRIIASATLIPAFGLGGAIASVFFHRLVLAAVIGHAIRTKYLNETSSLFSNFGASVKNRLNIASERCDRP